jgi:hypothetical protein
MLNFKLKDIIQPVFNLKDIIQPVFNLFTTCLLSVTTLVGLTSCSDRPTTPETTAQTVPTSITTNKGEKARELTAKKLEDEIDRLKKRLKPTPKYWTKVGMAIDLSASMNAAQTNRLQTADVKKLIDTAQIAPIELGMTLICDKSLKAMIRGKFASPPPILAKLLEPIELPKDSTEEGNPYDRDDRAAKFKSDLKEYDLKVTTRLQEIAAQNASLQEYDSKHSQLSKKFLDEVATILKAENSCRTTNIHNATDRIDSFLQEPDPTVITTLNKFVYVQTDGLDEFDKSTVKFTDPKVKVIIVHGGKSLGVLQNIPHQQFESPQAAIDSTVGQIQQ